MKQVLITILSIVIMLSASPQAGIYWMWKLNQGAIATKLCVERNLINNTCQGKCHLKAQLDAQENDHGTSLPIKREVNVMPLLCVDIDQEKLSMLSGVRKRDNPLTCHQFLDSAVSMKLLRPPELIS